MIGPSDSEARAFAAAYKSFLEWVHSDAAAGGRDRNEVVTLVTGFLGDGGLERSVVVKELPVFEQVNLQTAIDAWTAEEGRIVDVRGLRSLLGSARFRCSS